MIELIKMIYKHIHIFWLLIILYSLIISPDALLISFSYFLAPILIILSSVLPNIKLFIANPGIGNMETILIILILSSTITILYKLISRVIKKWLVKSKEA